MNKQTTPKPTIEYPLDIPEEIRPTFVRRFEEWRKEQQHRTDVESVSRLSEEEMGQINSALISIADKLNISGELRIINTLFQRRNARVVEVLTAFNINDVEGD